MEKDISEVGHITHVQQITYGVGRAFRVYEECCPCCGNPVIMDGTAGFNMNKWPYHQDNGQ